MWIHFVYFKVAIKRGCVHSYHSDTWFPLVHVEPDTEVQGRIHLEIKHYEFIPDTDDDEFSNTPKLSVRWVIPELVCQEVNIEKLTLFNPPSCDHFSCHGT